MVKGIEIFKEHFKDQTNKFVLIGGTACDITMEKMGIEFRATKDLDIVLIIEALDPDFAGRFWDFIKEGGYKNIQKSTNKKLFYRFYDPDADSYPYMLELFSRVPDVLARPPFGKITPIPFAEEISSLSAILLENDYYDFIRQGRIVLDDMPVLAAEYIIPLKAKAYLDLKNHKQSGHQIDTKDIRKHRNDVFRLYQVLTPDMSISLPPAIAQDFSTFFNAIENDNIDLKSIGIRNVKLADACQELYKIYNLDNI